VLAQYRCGEPMSLFVTRRAALAGSIAIACATSRPVFAAARPNASEMIAALERKSGGRLGVALLDVGTGARAGHRADERFAMCSTFKGLAVALALSRIDKGSERFDRRVTYTAEDVMPHSPVGKDHVAGGLTIGEICEAAITQSDNTAANLLLASFGGPAAFTAYARSLGDSVTRLDRIETELNDVKHGDERDTTTPNAMLDDLRKVVLGDALTPASRNHLKAWLIANKTGDQRLRAGLPRDWRVGDKTGTSGKGNFNDIAVIWPSDRGPLVVTAYYAEAPGTDDQSNAVIADVGRIAATWMQKEG
jgi:beta-lactamase class A